MLVSISRTLLGSPRMEHTETAGFGPLSCFQCCGGLECICCCVAGIGNRLGGTQVAVVRRPFDGI